MTARLFIVRHGNTFEKGDLVTRVGGRTDLQLSPSGLVQADALATHFASEGVGFVTARSGPLRRTKQTAQAILAAQAGAPDLLTELFLREIDYGPDENKPEEEVLARIGPSALEAWERQSIVPPGWRADPAAIIGNWQQLIAELGAIEGDHLILTSNGIARFALIAAELQHANPKLPTGGYGAIVVDGGATTLAQWGVRP